MTYPGGSFETWTYDANRKMTSRRTTAGNVEVFGYDERNRKVSMGWGGTTWANGLPYDNTYAYDKAGRLTLADNAVATVTRNYDAGGRLKDETETFKDGILPAHTMHHVYRYDGQMKELQLDPQVPAPYPYYFKTGYDLMGRLSTVMEANHTAADYEYFYDHASNVTYRYNPLGGDNLSYIYDNLSRTTERGITLSDASVWSMEHYALDSTGRVTGITRDEDTSTDTFTYNLSGELTSAVYVGTPTPTPTPPPAVATPTFNPAAGSYPSTDYPKTITITTTTTGAQMRYTTNGSNPTSTSGTLIKGSSGTASVPANATLKAIAFKSGMTDSAIRSGLYSVIGMVATPGFNPAAGSYPSADYPKTITISTTTTGAQMRYTTNGTNPTSTTGTLINGSSGTASVPANATLKAIGFKSGMTDSAIKSGTYSVTQVVATPSFNPVAGAYPSTDYPKTITISTTTTGAQMRYTTNGTNPTSTTGTLINGSTGTASVPSGATLKAIAFKSGMSDSAIKSGVYTATAACAAPVFNPANVISGPVPPAAYTVNISTTTSGAQMRYTRNGTTPTSTTGTLINGTSANITIGANTAITLKAITFKSGSSDSSVTSGYFDNQNGGGNRPPPGERKAGGESAQAEFPARGSKQAQSASSAAERETSLTRFELNLWHSAALREDPNLTLGWKKQGSQGGSDQATSGSRSVIYTLDLMGNRTNVSEDGVNKSYVVNSLNQYSTGHGAAVSNGPSHEISSYNGTSYQYTGDSYLAKATAGNNTYTLYYDALGRCVKRTSVTNGGTGVTNYYIFDGEHWVVEYDVSNTVQSVTVYGRGIDEIITRGIKDVGGYFYFQDRNGNTSVVTDGTTTIRESYRYDAFGLPTVRASNGAVLPGGTAINSKFMFTGREWNPTFGFYEYRARAYNPTLGRFMSEDPKGFEAGDYNLYRYVGNDPLDRVDPMGLDPGDPFQSAVDAGADAARFINPTSIRQNREYGGFIYKDSASGQYFATTPLKAGATGAQGVHVQLPKGSEVAGNYHTHGDYSKPDPKTGKPVRTTKDQDAYDSDQFSKSDIKISRLRALERENLRLFSTHLAAASGDWTPQSHRLLRHLFRLPQFLRQSKRPASKVGRSSHD